MLSAWVERTLQFLRTRIFRRLVGVVIFFCLYSAFVNAFEIELMGEKLDFANSITAFLTLAISMLMVFRTNSAYDRWWEARKIWGALVNESRNLVVKAVQLSSSPNDELESFQMWVSRFPVVLKSHLRDEYPCPAPIPEGVKHGPAYVSAEIYKTLKSWRDQGKIDEFGFLAIEKNANSLLDICGQSERIKNTPLPLSHRALIPQVLFMYLLVIPWGLPNHPATVCIVAGMAYFLVGLELVAEGLERPFQCEDDGLPLETLCQTIATTTREILAGPNPEEQGLGSFDPVASTTKESKRT